MNPALRPNQTGYPKSILRFAAKLISPQPDSWLRWLIAASLILPPTLFGFVAYQSHVATMMAADQQMIGTVRLLREHAEKVLDTNELVIQQVDLLAAGLSWDAIARSEVLHQQLKRLAGQFPQVGGIFLVAPDGTVANGSAVFPATPINVSDRDYFSALRDGYLGAFISYARQGRVTEGEQFNFARGRSAPYGTFDGVIEIAASPTYFWEAYRNVGSKRASVVLVRDNGEELAYYPTPMFSGPSAPDDPHCERASDGTAARQPAAVAIRRHRSSGCLPKDTRLSPHCRLQCTEKLLSSRIGVKLSF